MTILPEPSTESERGSGLSLRVLDSIKPALVVHDLDLTVLYCNRRALEILGVSDEDLLEAYASDSKPWTIYREDGTVAEVLPARAAIRTGEPQVDQLLRLVRSDGRERWLLLDAMPMFDCEGLVNGAAVTFLDVSERRASERAAAALGAQFRRFAENSQDALLVVGNDSKYTYLSPSVVRTHGWTPEALHGRSCEEILHPKDLLPMKALHQRQLAGAEPESREYRVRHPDGRYRWVDGSASPVRDASGAVTAVQYTVRDISERKADQEALRRANEQFAQAFVHAPIGMALISPQGRWLRVNPALCELLGYSEEQLLETSYSRITHPDDLAADLRLAADLLAGRQSSYQARTRYVRAGGEVIWVQVSVVAVRDEERDVSHFISQVQDITERHLMEDRLREMADRDHLTGLLNRRRFEEELRRQLDRCARSRERAALMILDLDGFKEINDTQGHAAGDAVLRSVSQLIAQRLRAIDVLARLGGDEFAVILVDSDAQGAMNVADAVVSAMREALHDGNGITLSAGVTELNGGDEPDAVLARADRAMYEVKHRGRDGVSLSL